MKWIPFKKKKPDTGDHICVYLQDINKTIKQTSVYSVETILCLEKDYNMTATHWVPLEKHPTEYI